MSPDDGVDFAGPAELTAGGEVFAVRVRLAGRVEPVDGRFHWGGRIAAHDGVAQLVRDGRREVTIRVDGPAAPARLLEVDAWGGVVLRATGRPPWSVEQSDVETR